MKKPNENHPEHENYPEPKKYSAFEYESRPILDFKPRIPDIGEVCMNIHTKQYYKVTEYNNDNQIIKIVGVWGNTALETGWNVYLFLDNFSFVRKSEDRND